MKKYLLSLLVVAFLACLLPAQSLTNALVGGQPAQTTTSDPLGRDTPSGTVLGFLQAAQAGNYKAAADYLQLSAVRRQSQGQDLASKLKLLMDRAFVGSVRRISTRPDGSPDSGDFTAQTIGSFSVDGEAEVPVVLVHASDPNGSKIWLFSSDTLAKVPDLYDNLRVHQIETRLPNILVGKTFLGMPLWQWLALLIFVPLAAASGWAIVLILAVPRRLWLRYTHKPNLHSYGRVSAPLLLFFGAFAHRIMAGFLGLPFLSRVYYYRTTGVVLAIGFFWFVLRVTGITMQRLRNHAIGAGHTGTSTLMLLGERLLKAIIAGIALLAVLGTLGFNLTTVLAGLGIGGLAIAFAAQKTLENLFGGVSVLADEVIRVGDFCRFGDRVGTVEDISLRSTRVRTLDRTILSIPNGTLATMNVENFARRDKILFNPTFGVRCETTPDQMRFLLAELRRMLYQHPKIEHESTRIRFAALADSSLNLEIFSYVLTADSDEFTAIREDLLLRIIEIVSLSGSSFAFPSRTVYMAHDPGLDKDRAASAEQQVAQWRDQNQLPFPDFSPADRSAFRGSIVYPPPESAAGGGKR
ncbi:MAG TPA: mechanosensitive ion channel family protein [Terriglobales bacterium]|nr:mechanosensitive ion channel family protein [Terriglobales bacterium]